MPRRASKATHHPEVGEVVRDLGSKGPDGKPAEGVYMDTLGGLAHLRPELGGCEWTTRPEYVQPLVEPRFIEVQHPSRPRTASRIGDAA